MSEHAHKRTWCFFQEHAQEHDFYPLFFPVASAFVVSMLRHYFPSLFQLVVSIFMSRLRHTAIPSPLFFQLLMPSLIECSDLISLFLLLQLLEKVCLKLC